MNEKPTYEDLEQEVQKLRKEVFGLRILERDSSIFKNAVDSSISAIGITDVEEKLIYVNDSCVKMWGYDSKDEILGRLLPEFWEGDGIYKTAKELREKGAASGEDIGKRKDGSLFYVQFNANMFKDETGNPAFMFGSFFDITEHKHAENALKTSEKKFRFLTENITDIIWTMDMDLKYTYFSPSIERLQGFTPEEAVNLTLDKTLTPDSLDKAMKVYGEELEKLNSGKRDPKIPTKIELEVICKDESIIPVEVEANVILGHDGSPMSILGVTREITERKRAEKELIQAHNDLEQRVKERTRELEKQKKRLEEVNTALNVMLKKREEDKQRIEEKVLFNVKELIEPLIKNFKDSGLDDNQTAYVDTLETFLKEIVSPFTQTLHSAFKTLTLAEIRVANLVKEGNTTKEIARLLSSTPRAIEFHRQNIRKKLGLSNRKANLGSHLLSFLK